MDVRTSEDGVPGELFEPSMRKLTFSRVTAAFSRFLPRAGAAEEATLLSEAEWREVFDHNSIMYFMVDASAAVRLVNAFGSAQLGYRADELIGQSVLQLYSEADRERVRANFDLCLQSLDQSNTWEVQKVRKDGETLWVRETATAIKRMKGGLVVVIAGEDITERRRAEESVRESARRFRALIEHAFDAVLLLDANSALVYASPSTERILGYSPGELVGRDGFDLVHPDQLRDAKEQFTAANGHPGSVYTAERLIRHKLGKWLWTEITVTNLLGESTVRAFVINLRDITQRKQAEEAQRASEARFRIFVDHATDGFFLFDQAVLDVNRQACESLGYSREEMIGMHPQEFDAGLDTASIERIGERVESGETVTFETVHRRKDGTVFPVEIRARLFQQGAHRLRLALARDITERKHAEQVLRESEAKLQKAQKIAHFGWWERDFTTNRVSLSDEVSKIFGLDPVDLPGWHTRWLNLIHPEDRRRADEAAAAALLPGGPRYEVEYRVVRPDGAERTVHSQGDVTWDESGQPERQFGVLQDITELRQAERDLRASEEALRRSEAYLAKSQRLSHTGTSVFNATTTLYWSEECYRVWGLDPLQGLPDRETVWQRIHPDDRERVRALVLEAWRQKRAYEVESKIVLPDGTVRHIESTGYPLVSGEAEHLELVATHVDVTERVRAQEQSEKLRQLESELAHMNRLSIMGELTASLAHEILHPIATARNNARAGMRFLDRTPPDLDEVKEALGCVVRDADRAKDIVGRVREHVKKAPPRKQPFDINEAIDEVIVMARGAIIRNKVSVRALLSEEMIPNSGRSCSTATGGPEPDPERGRSHELGKGRARVIDRDRAKPNRRHSGRGAQLGTGHRSGTARASFRSLLYDQDQRPWDGAGDLPVHHRRAWGSFVGRRQ